jgi:hypothetical protein
MHRQPRWQLYIQYGLAILYAYGIGVGKVWVFWVLTMVVSTCLRGGYRMGGGGEAAGLRIRIRIRIRIHMFLGLPDPDILVRGMNPDPDPSIIMQK